MMKNWTLLKNGNFTKLLILLLLSYVLGNETFQTITGGTP